ncbi:MAG: 3-hydroxyacyl-CoA dehydrogenase family protein [Pseudomonadota bacterium]
MLDDYFKNVTVIGAAGKMGSGISLLVLQEMIRIELEKKNGVGTGDYRLNLIDMNEKSLQDLVSYLRSQLVKYAEKEIVSLRKIYKEQKDIVENSEVISDFVNKALLNIRCDTDLSKAQKSLLVFEAILEDFNVKVDLYSKLKKMCSEQTYFFTNTSSVPISLIDETAELSGRLIGFHFYNPPAVQKLVEVICAKNGKKELKEMAYDFGKRLKKILVPSNDVPGFIGNGHFLRDVLYSINLFDQLRKDFSSHEAIYIVNRVTQDFMVRPMGIFQLHDYVGVDVCGHILRIMKTYLKDNTFESQFINNFLQSKIIGGQYPDGSQKDGILKYEKGKISAIYNLDEKRYFPLTEGTWKNKCDDYLGKIPDNHFPWKLLSKDANKDEKLQTYFKTLFAGQTPGALLAQKYLIKSRDIARALVSQKVAENIEDVNKVLQNGFFHLYGADNQYF